MEENKQEPVNQNAPRDGEIARELAHVRSRNKVLKIATIVVSVLFVFLLGVVIFMFQKLSGLRDVLTAAQTFQGEAFKSVESPAPDAAEDFKGLPSSTDTSAGSSMTTFTNASEYAEQEGGTSGEEGEKVLRLLAKYSSRPIVKDFIAELKKDPDFVKAFNAKNMSDPMAMVESMKQSKSMPNLVARFAMRRDFPAFMMELMKDPEMKPLMSKLPIGDMGSMARMLQGMQGADAPAPAPRQARKKARAAVPLEPEPTPVEVEEEEYEDEAEEVVEDPATLDNSAMGSPDAARVKSLRKKSPPPPAN